jgi:hypothetical protein
MKIRYSQDAEDVRTLVERGKATCREAEFGFELSVDLIVQSIADWLKAFPGTLIIATEDDDEPIGFAALSAHPTIGTETPVAVIKHWYAQPNRALVGPKLFCLARDWGTKQNCTHFMVSASQMASDHYESVVRFCRNVGMQEFETSYICRLNEV